MRELPEIKYIAVVDLETAAKTPDAHIYSIGISMVDVENLSVAGEFYARLDDKQLGRVKDADTLNWWLGQAYKSADAFDELFCNELDEKPVPIYDALLKMLSWLKEFGDPKTIHLMGNGSEFDNVILEHAINQAGLKNPIPYYNNQSLRTIKLIHRLLNDADASYALENLPFKGRKHHALDDAKHEAEQLLRALEMIRSYKAYDQDITELKEQLQHQKLVYEQKLKELEQANLTDIDTALYLKERSSAWQSVVNTLDEVTPNWLFSFETRGMTAPEAAVFVIKAMASESQQPFNQQENPVELSEDEEVVYITEPAKQDN